MDSKSVSGWLARAPWLLAVVLLAGAPVWSAARPAITRGPILREGGAWVEDLHCDFPLHSGAWLAVRADRGSVDVKPGPPDRVRCRVHLAAYIADARQARDCLESYRLQALPTDSGLELTGRFVCAAPAQALSAAFELKSPLKMNLNLSTGQGGVSIERLDGQLRAHTDAGDVTTGEITGRVSVSTGGGQIRLGDLGASAQAESGGGGIRVGNVNGALDLETRGGDITAGVVNGPVEARTGAGSVRLQAASGPVVAISQGGQIRLGQCGSSVSASTAGGNVQVAGAHGRITAQTAGGNISLLQAMSSVLAETARGRILARIDASPKTFGPSRFFAGGGDVDLLLPPELPVTIRAIMSQPAYPIISDFRLKIRKPGTVFAPRSVHAEGSIAGGGKNVYIEVGTGGIQIRKLDRAEAARMLASQVRFWSDWRQAQTRQTLRQLDALRQQLEQQSAALQQQLRQLNRQLEDSMQQQVQYVGP